MWELECVIQIIHKILPKITGKVSRSKTLSELYQPKVLLPKERRDEISDQVDKLDGITSDKNLKMKREWIIREKSRLDEIEALKDMAREAEKRRKRYLSLRHVPIQQVEAVVPCYC